MSLLCAAATVLLIAGPASADVIPWIVGGTEVTQNDKYPAQGALFIDLDGDGTSDSLCGGTLVGSRYFLTAAHCVVDDLGFALPASRFLVFLGNVDLRTPPSSATDFDVVAVESNAAFNLLTFQNDTAMLRLERAAPFSPLRVIGTDEGAKWAPGTTARIIGWGKVDASAPSTTAVLREASVPIISDAVCAADYPPPGPEIFDANTMVCAYDGVHDTCQGDSGGPLMVPDTSGFVLAGITSWGIGCAGQNQPGVYTRLGAPAINQWVMARYPRASFTAGPAHSGQPTQLTSTSFHPDGAGGFNQFSWDFNNDGVYVDSVGNPVNWSFPQGVSVVGLRATGPSGDVATARGTIAVNGTPSAVAGGETPYGVREGSTITLTGAGADPEGQPLDFRWDLDGDRSFETVGRQPRFSAVGLDGPVTRVVGLRVCDTVGGCATDTALVRIANAPPRANAGRDRAARRSQRIAFRVRAVDPGRDRLRVTWRFGDRTRARGARVSHRYRRAGRYTVTVTVVDDDGAATVDRVRVRIRR